MGDPGAAAGEPNVVEKLKKGASYSGQNFKVHLDGFDQTALFSGKRDLSVHSFIFYYDEARLTATRYKQFKITFSVKMNGKWDDPLVHLGRPITSNLLMDPFRTPMARPQSAIHRAQDVGDGAVAWHSRAALWEVQRGPYIVTRSEQPGRRYD